MASNKKRGLFAFGFLVGVSVGIVVRLMMTSKKGEHTRTEVWGRSQTLRSRADEMAASVRGRVEPTVSGAIDRIEHVGDSVTEGVRERINPVVGQVGSRLGRGHSTTESNGASGSDMPLDEHATGETDSK